MVLPLGIVLLVFWGQCPFSFLVCGCERNTVRMTEIVVTDCNLNSVCERLEQHCCVDDPSAIKRHTNTGAKLWGRVRSKLLRQKVTRSFILPPSVTSSLQLLLSFSQSVFCLFPGIKLTESH